MNYFILTFWVLWILLTLIHFYQNYKCRYAHKYEDCVNYPWNKILGVSIVGGLIIGSLITLSFPKPMNFPLEIKKVMKTNFIYR